MLWGNAVDGLRTPSLGTLSWAMLMSGWRWTGNSSLGWRRCSYHAHLWSWSQVCYFCIAQQCMIIFYIIFFLFQHCSPWPAPWRLVLEAINIGSTRGVGPYVEPIKVAENPGSKKSIYLKQDHKSFGDPHVHMPWLDLKAFPELDVQSWWCWGKRLRSTSAKLTNWSAWRRADWHSSGFSLNMSSMLA